MKTVYQYDQINQKLITSKNVNDDYVLKDGETSIAPTPGLYDPLIFDGIKWTGATYEDWLANRPEPELVVPSEQDKINAQLLQQAAAQQMTNEEIIKEIATIKGGK